MTLDLCRNSAERSGILTLEQPPETYTENGFTKREFARVLPGTDETDPVHMNASYGGLVLDSLSSMLRDLERSPLN